MYSKASVVLLSKKYSFLYSKNGENFPGMLSVTVLAEKTISAVIIKQIKNWKMLVLSNFVGGGNKNNRKICKIIYFLQGKMIKKITEILVLENCM